MMYGTTTFNGYPMTMEERFVRYKNTGLDSLLLWWGKDETPDREGRVKLAEKHGLVIENVHAMTDGLNMLWNDKVGGEQTLTELLTEIEDCSRYGVKTIVIHLTNGKNPPAISEMGIARIEKMIALAERNKVQLAFENVSVSKHLKYILDNYDSPYVGMCYDSGHEHCWTSDVDWLGLYRKRIFAIHLHDNDGNKDAHLLPFEGTIDWDLKMRKIAESSYAGSITIEAEYNSKGVYADQGLDAFLLKTYEVGIQLDEFIKRYRK